MTTAIIAVTTLIGGGVLGYLVRLREFRRERRLAAYSEVVGEFMSVIQAGAALLGVHMRFGEKMFSGEHADVTVPAWTAWGTAAKGFETAATRLRLIGSDEARAACDELVLFHQRNVRDVPPFTLTEGTAGWGDAAKVGPRRVEEEGTRLARVFADRVRVDI